MSETKIEIEIVSYLRILAGDLQGSKPGAAERLQEAADEIERLRALVGKAQLGPSFSEITKDLSRRGLSD